MNDLLRIAATSVLRDAAAGRYVDQERLSWAQETMTRANRALRMTGDLTADMKGMNHDDPKTHS
jgi:hypothetical protein